MSELSDDDRRDLVFGVVDDSLVFLPRKQATKLFAIHEALATAKTWGELHKALPRDAWEEVLDMVDRPPRKDAPFDSGQLGGYCDGLWPAWPAGDMARWVPKTIPHATVESSVHDGPFLQLDPAHRDEIVAAFEAAGFRCTEKQAMVRHACGY